jgi:hypothetical protein
MSVLTKSQQASINHQSCSNITYAVDLILRSPEGEYLTVSERAELKQWLRLLSSARRAFEAPPNHHLREPGKLASLRSNCRARKARAALTVVHAR